MIEEVSVKYIRRNNCSNKSCWNNNQRIFVPAITDGTVVPTMIVVTAVSTRAVETAAKEIFVPAIIVGTIVPTKIVGTAVPTIIVLTAYYWISCDPPPLRLLPHFWDILRLGGFPKMEF